MQVRDWTPEVPLQAEAAECGLVCLAALCAMYGHDVSVAGLKARFGISTRGLAVSQLLRILREGGFDARAVLLDFARPEAICSPCIALKDQRHFVVLGRRRGRQREFFDPESGWDFVDEDLLPIACAGPVVELRAGPDVPILAPRARLSLRRWLAQFSVARRLAMVTATALVAYSLVLATPQLARHVIDAAVAREAMGPLLFAVVAFGLLSLIGIAARLAARRVAARVSSRLGTDLGLDVARRLLALPLDFLSRFSPETLTGKVTSSRLVQDFVLRLGGATLIQAAVAVAAWAFQAFIAWPFALIVLAFTALALPLDAWLTRRVSAATERLHRASVRNAEGLNEMSRSASTIVAYGASEPVLARRALEARLVEQATVRYDDARRWKEATKAGVLAIEQSLFLGLGAWSLATGWLSFGDYVALGLYRELYNSGIGEVRDALSDARVLDRAAGRLEDVVLLDASPPASVMPPANAGAPAVSIKDLAFRYSSFDPWVFHGLSLDIAAGEHVAIVGPSGCGKTTLAKLLVGALPAAAGQIRVGEVAVGAHSAPALAARLGTVMQFDHIISGSVEENIAFFRGCSFDQVRAAAQFAEIAEMIEALPMKYETPISDSFAGFSGGQRQRILIARAMCARPQILIMDEATSFLDAQTEKMISQRIRRLGITRITFAHRQETIRSADRVIDLAALHGASASAMVAA